MNKSEGTEYITVEEIKQILVNYRIGKKPLAKLLGWGETTIIRYVEGDVPTREYSDKLKYIMHNPGYFNEILEQNKASLTPVAYRKCSQAVKERLLVSKIRVVAQYIINRLNGHVSLYELEMYLYCIQGFYLAMEGEAMFEDEFLINTEEMPYETIYEDYRKRNITTMDLKKDALTKKEKEFINDIIDALSWYGPATLSVMLHYDIMIIKPSRDSMDRKILAKDSIKTYFSMLIKENSITSSSQIHKYFYQVFKKLLQAEWNI